MHVVLTPELESFVRMQIQSGGYDSVDQVVEAALGLLQERQVDRNNSLFEFRKVVDDTLASLERGEGVDGESFVLDLLGKIDRLETTRKTG